MWLFVAWVSDEEEGAGAFWHGREEVSFSSFITKNFENPFLFETKLHFTWSLQTTTMWFRSLHYERRPMSKAGRKVWRALIKSSSTPVTIAIILESKKSRILLKKILLIVKKFMKNRLQNAKNNRNTAILIFYFTLVLKIIYTYYSHHVRVTSLTNPVSIFYKLNKKDELPHKILLKRILVSTAFF